MFLGSPASTATSPGVIPLLFRASGSAPLSIRSLQIQYPPGFAAATWRGVFLSLFALFTSARPFTAASQA